MGARRSDSFAVFRNRREAGQRLAAALGRFKDEKPLVLALPRGGVPVAFEVARALVAPLDLLLVRKLGAPGQPELGIGAVVDGTQPFVVLNDEVVELLKIPPRYIEAETRRQLAEMGRRHKLYRGDRPASTVEGRTIILVDDGIATGSTVRAVLRALRRAKAARCVLAIPVAPKETLATLASEADDIVCLASPEPYFSVGGNYVDFTQTTDDEVLEMLDKARDFTSDAA